MYSSYIHEWMDHDEGGELLYYDEGGWTASWRYGESLTIWALTKFVPDAALNIKSVEFYTTDASPDIDVYLYDSFVSYNLSGLLASKLNLSYDEAGYHSVALDNSVHIDQGDDVYAVVKFTNESYGFPLAVDHLGPYVTGKNYFNILGPGYPMFWLDIGDYYDKDLTIRIRGGGTIPYLPGDVNMAGGTWPPSATGPDVTYLVNYFRSAPTSHSCLLDGFWCSADANGDCNIIGSDVTKLVNVFRGQGSILYCEDYTPAWPTPLDLPAEAPEGWPGCEE